jgi:hypothetical protein
MEKGNYKIEMGSEREDYNIYYSEISEQAVPKRRLVAAIDVKQRLFNSRVKLYLNTFRRWNVNGDELSFNRAEAFDETKGNYSEQSGVTKFRNFK